MADLATEPHTEVVYLGSSGTRQCDLDTRLRQLPATRPQLVGGYDAGPCG
jgi:hypothetical protein